jgi:hypothetical protein
MRILTGMVVASICSSVFAADVSPELKAEITALKKHVSMGPVKQTEFRDPKTDEKFEVFKVITQQDKDSTFMGVMRFTVEMKDKSGVYYGQIVTKQRPSPTTDENYSGEHAWEFQIPHGQLKYPKFPAYAMEFGIETNKTIVPVVAKSDGAESGDEITARNTDPQKKLKLKPGKTRPIRAGVAGE